MSGGSYDYASSSSDLDDLIRNKSQLTSMLSDIEDLGYADDVAKLMTEMFLHLRHFEILAEMYCKKLGNIWHEFEWWRSNDRTEEQFKEALRQFRLPNWKGPQHEAKKS